MSGFMICETIVHSAFNRGHDYFEEELSCALRYDVEFFSVPRGVGDFFLAHLLRSTWQQAGFSLAYTKYTTLEPMLVGGRSLKVH